MINITLETDTIVPNGLSILKGSNLKDFNIKLRYNKRMLKLRYNRLYKYPYFKYYKIEILNTKIPWILNNNNRNKNYYGR